MRLGSRSPLPPPPPVEARIALDVKARRNPRGKHNAPKTPDMQLEGRGKSLGLVAAVVVAVGAAVGAGVVVAVGAEVGAGVVVAVGAAVVVGSGVRARCCSRVLNPI
jgi:hypothetical protein